MKDSQLRSLPVSPRLPQSQAFSLNYSGSIMFPVRFLASRKDAKVSSTSRDDRPCHKLQGPPAGMHRHLASGWCVSSFDRRVDSRVNRARAFHFLALLYFDFRKDLSVVAGVVPWLCRVGRVDLARLQDKAFRSQRQGHLLQGCLPPGSYCLERSSRNPIYYRAQARIDDEAALFLPAVLVLLPDFPHLWEFRLGFRRLAWISGFRDEGAFCRGNRFLAVQCRGGSFFGEAQWLVDSTMSGHGILRNTAVVSSS